jgi:hypothetical protein
LKVTVRSSPEWVWWNERVRVSFSAVASFTEEPAAISSREVRLSPSPIREIVPTSILRVSRTVTCIPVKEKVGRPHPSPVTAEEMNAV